MNPKPFTLLTLLNPVAQGGQLPERQRVGIHRARLAVPDAVLDHGAGVDSYGSLNRSYISCGAPG